MFNLYADYIMWNTWLDEAQAGIKIAGRNVNNLRYTDDTTLMAENEELKSLLIKVKEETEKVGLKLNIQKTKIMASSPNTWQMDGETMETVRDYFFWAPKSLQLVTVAKKLKDVCSLEGKLWPTYTASYKAETLPTKVHLVKAMIFPVVMYGCESWTIKKAEGRRIDAFELWYWKRLLRVPWTAKRSYQSILS